jgi:two-component system cell cycle response regulator
MSGRILVVDDELEILQLEEMILTRAGYEVDTAADGSNALERLAGADYDLVVLDVMMPGIDGFEVCRRIKADPRLAALPVLFLTARDQPKALLEGFKAGAAMYISKPFSEAKLLALVSTLVGTRQT